MPNAGEPAPVAATPPSQDVPAAPSPRDWSEAAERLLNFLRASGLRDDRRRIALAEEILREAEQRHAQAPARAPVEITLELAFSKTDTWRGDTNALLANPDLTPAPMIARERDYGALEAAHETLQRFEWMPVFRAFVIWSVIWIAAYATYLRYHG